MLLGAIEHVQRSGGDPRTFFGKVYGEEKNLTTSSIAREDRLRNPAFSDSSAGRCILRVSRIDQ